MRTNDYIGAQYIFTYTPFILGIWFASLSFAFKKKLFATFIYIIVNINVTNGHHMH